MIEYIIWGIPPDCTQEVLLVSEHAGIESMGEANLIMKGLETKHGCKQCRVQTIDLSKPPDFIKAINV